MFNKILIANRGEIACRVIKTARALGIATVAVHSDADADARFVKLADEAYRLGPAPAADSYLRGDLILDIARRSGAQAIHPGYGFLSENEDFAAACEASGIAFIGPPASAIAAMGSKSAAKALMEQAQVPLVPGYHGERQEPDFLRGQADAIGYPVLIKASAGGGGKGMRIVEASADFEAALASCQREARASFGDDKVLVEKYLPRSRHVEIQVFADRQGQCVYLFERDCSVQRRHQKVLEEAPAPDLPPATREAMGAAACAAARAVGYVGAGTVEFIMEVLADGSPGRFFFMEMNTRLQVEHPVTEMITGQDLVTWQLTVASGLPLPLSQEQLRINGHAIEARIYAEDPDKGFLPATGTLYHLRTPAESAVVRIDTGVVAGDSISPFYDPMIAKLIVWGEDRRQALQRLDAALADYQVAGVTTNIPFLRRIVQHASFASGQVDTGLIARHHDALLPPPAAPDAEQLALLALAEALAAPGAYPASAGWRLNGALSRSLVFHIAGENYPVTLRHQGDGFEITAACRQFSAAGRLDGGTLRARLDDKQLEAVVARSGQQRVLFAAGQRLEAQWLDPLAVAAEEVHGETHLKAPMPGRIVALLAATGVKLNKGDPLLILEAMKMEHTIPAPADGVVKAFYFGTGEQVNDGDELVDFEAE
ncbi:acetyl/propionyl/methylcrotonyl-CoA carboxylase subunit alpha [Chromobacterium haemolyticum]|uniref:acetyl/propionyl/methylcrotonyl-CoA carboxylase subunit alpha n=1 Tax=Chromobacterium haemolyticum TaxID=394935 RepID=UPI0013178148|nr:acetyl/propionyl/methylcrotonyl-CoA carboxylase subunit alpha [Chromobacterium haemolyticum]BBH11947.1 3-methylcrotonyl-CoA carboxylase subunit alpha [Chromobacterium haemolyticum]